MRGDSLSIRLGIVRVQNVEMGKRVGRRWIFDDV